MIVSEIIVRFCPRNNLLDRIKEGNNDDDERSIYERMC